MSLSDPKAEAAVKKLAKLPHNTVCPNCGTSKKFGFGTVCIKFLTFVCNECKSSHQAISHRCKSLTMSSWTQAEVLALQKSGNDVARQTWLATAPPIGTGGRPKPGDDLNIFKSFIVDVYERKRYLEANRPTGRPSLRVEKNSRTKPAAQKKTGKETHSKIDTPASTPAFEPVVDLLDFGKVTVSKETDDTFTQEQKNNDSFDPFGNNDIILQNRQNSINMNSDYKELQPTQPHQIRDQPQQNFDPFRSSVTSTTLGSPNVSNDPIEKVSTTAPVTNSFDPFGVSSLSSHVSESIQPQKHEINKSSCEKPPVMNNNKSLPVLNSGGIGMLYNNVNPMLTAQQFTMQQQQFMQQQQMMAFMMNQQQMHLQNQQQQMMCADAKIGANITTFDKAHQTIGKTEAKGKDPFADLF